MRVFVAGATGAIGRRIVPLLLGQGHTVTAAGRSPAALHALAAAGATPALLDLLDGPAVHAAVAGHDAVINVATRVPSPSRMLFPGAWKPMDRIRTTGSANIAGAAIANGVGRLIQESYAPTYPDSGNQWITERTPIAPARHARSVGDAEHSALSLTAAGGTAVILRFANFYGPGDAFAEQVFKAVRKGWSPFLGTPDGYLPLVTHDDAAAAAVAALTLPAGFYNVVDDEPMTREALVTSIARQLGTRPPKFLPPWLARLGGSLGDTLSRSLRISNRKLREASSWSPTVPNGRLGFELALAGETTADQSRTP
jgi:nucleoside-diphosphate-sugar epimerase